MAYQIVEWVMDKLDSDDNYTSLETIKKKLGSFDKNALEIMNQYDLWDKTFKKDKKHYPNAVPKYGYSIQSRIDDYNDDYYEATSKKITNSTTLDELKKITIDEEYDDKDTVGPLKARYSIREEQLSKKNQLISDIESSQNLEDLNSIDVVSGVSRKDSLFLRERLEERNVEIIVENKSEFNNLLNEIDRMQTPEDEPDITAAEVERRYGRDARNEYSQKLADKQAVLFDEANK